MSGLTDLQATPGATHLEHTLPISFACAGCGYQAPPGQPGPAALSRTPARTTTSTTSWAASWTRPAWSSRPASSPNPFVRYRTLFHAYHLALAARLDGRPVRRPRRAPRRGDRGRRRRGLPGHPVRPERGTERPARVRARRWRLREGRDRQRQRLAQGAPPDGHAPRTRGRRDPGRRDARPATARHRELRQRRAGSRGRRGRCRP